MSAPTRLVLAVVGGALLVSLLGIIVLAGLERTIPDVLPMVATASLTGLVGLLAPAPRSAPRHQDDPAG